MLARSSAVVPALALALLASPHLVLAESAGDPSASPPPSLTPAPEPVPPPASSSSTGRLRSPFQLHAAIDAPLIAIGMTIWILPYALVTEALSPPSCGTMATGGPCDSSKVNAFDRYFIRFHDPNAGLAGDLMFYALPVFYTALQMGDYGARNYPGYLTDAGVLVETLAWSGTFDEIFRRAVRRPRPYLYEPLDVYPDKRETAEATYSFYSGHTAAMFAFAVSTAYSFHLRHPHSKWRWPLWVGLITYAAAEGVLRVVSGDHFPTDVIAGAVVGTGIGVLIPALHRRRDLPLAVSSLQLLPSTSVDGSSFVSLAGRFE